MRHVVNRSGVADNSVRCKPQLLSNSSLTLALALAVAAVSIACAGFSQAGNSSSSSSSLQEGQRIAVSFPATSGQVGVSYNVVASVSGGTAPYSFTYENGDLPPGILLNAKTGSITGTPTQQGNYNFILVVADSTKGQGAATVNIAVAAGTNKQPPTITVSPSSISMVSQSVQQFTAAVTGESNAAVTWSASAGTISNSGSFTAPTVSSNTSVTVTATSAASSSLKASATVTVTPAAQKQTITISPSSLSMVSKAVQQFTATVTGTSNTAVTWSASAGTISSSGSFTAPTVSSNTSVTITATSAASSSLKASAAVTVTPAAQQPTITISPTSASVLSQGVQQFAATVTGTSNTGVTWSASVGTISTSGSFTAPKVSSKTSVTVTATSTASNSLSASASVTVNPLPALSITTTSIGDATVGVPFSANLAATGGKSPYTWSISSGALPAGIQLTASSGAIAGTASSTGAFNFTAKVTDSAGSTATQAYSLSVATNTGYDGPAQLPLVYIQTAMADTPAPGSTIAVTSGGNLQTALNSANCGDTITLQAGATFTGVFTFPAKNCNNNNWIIVRTSSPDSALPAEGSRLTPCYSGVASLPGRPALNCNSTTNVTAKIVMSASGVGPIIFATGADYYRLIGLEVTRTPNTGIVYELASIAAGGTANNLILDRMWLHGTAQDETGEGLELIGASYVSVIDSTLTDLHCISVTGSCTDAHAIGGGVDNPVGPFKITDNFLEASGENIMFGGAQATITPADIQISQNHFFKPFTWMPGQSGFVGGANGNPFIVKNFLELKNAQRVLVEANIMEDNWGGFSQSGYGIVITPKNQAASNGTGNLCPVCQVTDVTIRYNQMSHVGSGLQIANALSDNEGGALAGERYSLHDLVIDDINPVKYNGTGYLAEIMSLTGTALLQSVDLNHITAFPPSGLFSMGDTTGKKIPNFTFTNSLVSSGTYPIWSTGGGTANCAYYDVPLTTFNACFSPYTITANGLISTPSAYPASSWPAGNLFPANPTAVQFTNYNNGNGGNYLLLPGSPYKNAGTDGNDLGADITGLQSQLAGVE